MKLPEASRKHLHDVGRVIAEIERYAGGTSEARLLANRDLQLIFEREFEILGEALVRLLRVAPVLEDRITDVRRIIGLHNVLAHGYDSVDHRILWAAIVAHLPQLKSEVEQLISA